MMFVRRAEVQRLREEVAERSREGAAKVADLQDQIDALMRMVPDADSAITSRFAPLEREAAVLAGRCDKAEERLSGLAQLLLQRVERLEADVKELKDRKGASPEVIDRLLAAEKECAALRGQVRHLHGKVSKDPEFTPAKKAEPERPAEVVLGGPGWGADR